MNDAPTPRTDALIHGLMWLDLSEGQTLLGVMDRHARTLERESERYRLASLKLDTQLAREREKVRVLTEACKHVDYLPRIRSALAATEDARP